MQDNLTYENALSELEQIVSAVERGELPISELTVKLKRAQELLAFCQTQLTQVETDINALLTPKTEVR
ncbi:MAG: exodeoxyribonuclease VII small subunit [Bacteroidales bacterium]|nr:exodeoxyribonuclease VII small subunit [Bacteroidales bacterium]